LNEKIYNQIINNDDKRLKNENEKESFNKFYDDTKNEKNINEIKIDEIKIDETKNNEIKNNENLVNEKIKKKLNEKNEIKEEKLNSIMKKSNDHSKNGKNKKVKFSNDTIDNEDSFKKNNYNVYQFLFFFSVLIFLFSYFFDISLKKKF
jgi:hypothetical protein